MPSDGLPKNLEPLEAGDPATIGPYLLAGRLGSGGMGTVYLGRTPDRDALVAIKVIRPELAFDEATRARFRDEMEHARRVASFCTAKILDHGTFEGRPYMVTEYISGTALAEHIADHGALDSSTLHGFALGVAAALHAIHGAGLVHRDLKPANVLLSLSGPRVIDFGIARALNTVSNHTQTGIVMGSPGWMAPEQLLEETVTTAADIFAWGCLVAFAGTGTHPFGNGDAMTLGKRVLFAEPQIGSLDSPLDRLVRAALEKKPERRPKAQDLLLDLAGGGTGGESSDPNAMVSHALHQSWRPPVPPVPPGHPGGGPAGHHTAGRPVHGRPAPPPPGPHQQPYGPPGSLSHGQAAAVQHPANQSQQMQRPAPDPNQGYMQRPAPQTGQFAAVPPHATGPIPQAPPSGHQGSTRPPAAQPYVPPVPPAPHQPAGPEKRRLRWVAGAVVVGVVLLSLLLAALLWLGSDGVVQGPGQQPVQEQEEVPSEPDAPAIGDEEPQREAEQSSELGTVWDSGVMFTVHEPECRNEPREQGLRCEFFVSSRNGSSDVVHLDPLWQAAQEQDDTVGVWIEADPSAADSGESLWQPIPPDADAEGTLVFRLRGDAEPEQLRLRSKADSQGEMLRLADLTD